MDITRNSNKSYGSSSSRDSGYSNSIASSSNQSKNTTSQFSSNKHVSHNEPFDVVSECQEDQVSFETEETLPQSLRSFSFNKVINSGWNLKDSLNLSETVCQKLEQKMIRMLFPSMVGATEGKYLSESDDESYQLPSSPPQDDFNSSPPRKVARMDSFQPNDPSNLHNNLLPDPTLCILVTAELAREAIRYVSLGN